MLQAFLLYRDRWFTPGEIMALLHKEIAPQDMAELFALTATQLSLLHHISEDTGDPWAEYHCHAWEEVADALQKQIFVQLLLEGLLDQIPETGKYYALEPFMRRWGYRLSGGWWLPVDS